MENLHQLLINRRSIRKYKDTPLKPDDVRLILEAALLSPSSKSSRAWHLVAVEDRDTLHRMSQCKAAGAMPIAKAPLAVVVAMDYAKDDAWIEDAAVASTLMMLQAADLGIGSCWIEIRDRYQADGTPAQEIIQELLGIPETHPVVSVITFGYKDEERKPQDVSKLLWENVHIGNWGEQ